jgi:hypothetical protein
MSPFFVRLESVKVVPFTIFRIDSVTSQLIYTLIEVKKDAYISSNANCTR